MALLSVYNQKYMPYVVAEGNPELDGFLQFSENEVEEPYTEFEVEEAKSGNEMVNIKSRYNEKYLVRHNEQSHWIVAGADEPNEDLNTWSCTLFKIINIGDSNIRLRHAQLDKYACVHTTPYYDSFLYIDSPRA